MIKSISNSLALLIALILFSTGNLHSQNEQTRDSSFVLKIHSSKKTYSKKERPVIYIHIKNNTDSSIYLVFSSFRTSKSPKVFFKVENIGVKNWQFESNLMGCGNYACLSSNEFKKLAPGEEIELNLEDPRFEYQENFATGGTYRVTFYYSTIEKDFDKWLGECSGSWFDYYMDYREIKPAYAYEYNYMLSLFSKIPKKEFVSNTIEFKVR